MFKESIYLFQKDLLLELRQRYAIGGILLYVVSTVFVVYHTVGQRVGDVKMMEIAGRMGTMREIVSNQSSNGTTWSALFWLVVLFASVNAVAKSFIQENSARQLYYYTLANPIAVLLGKMMYNICLLSVLSIISFGCFAFIVGNPIKNAGLFYLVLLLAGVGLSVTLTFISAIAAKASNASTLVAILGFPVLLPILMTLIRLSKYALGILNNNAWSSDVLILLSIDVILVSLALVLFPYLWRE